MFTYSLSVCVRETETEKKCAYLQYSFEDKPTRLSINSLSAVLPSYSFSRSVCHSGESWGTLYQFFKQLSLAPPPPNLWFLSLSFVWSNVRQTNTDGDKHTEMVRGRRPRWLTSTMLINPASEEMSIGPKLLLFLTSGSEQDIHWKKEILFSWTLSAVRCGHNLDVYATLITLTVRCASS